MINYKTFTLCLILIVTTGMISTLSGKQQNQDAAQVRIETNTGDIFTGTLISEDENQLVVRTTSLGDVTILRANIRHIRYFDASATEKDFWYENPQSTRYFFSPNALGIEKGKGYYQNIWIFFNNVNYGVSDNFSIGGGVVPVFLFGVGGTPVWVLPKVSIPVLHEKFHLSAGAMLGGVVGIDESETAGILYGLGTYGDRNNNISLGLGYGFASGEISSSPVITLSGMYRARESLYYISENYFFPGSDAPGILSLGIRWAPENFAVDFSLVRPLLAEGRFIGLPLLGVTIPFGRM